MSEPLESVEVGPNIEMPFFVMTDAGFPHGLRCITCRRQINPGQPYISQVDGIYDNGDTIGPITCVYCTSRSGDAGGAEQ